MAPTTNDRGRSVSQSPSHWVSCITILVWLYRSKPGELIESDSYRQRLSEADVRSTRWNRRWNNAPSHQDTVKSIEGAKGPTNQGKLGLAFGIGHAITMLFHSSALQVYQSRSVRLHSCTSWDEEFGRRGQPKSMFQTRLVLLEAQEGEATRNNSRRAERRLFVAACPRRSNADECCG